MFNDKKFKKDFESVTRFDRNYDACPIRNINSNYNSKSKSKEKEKGYELDLKQVERKIKGKIIKILKLLFSAIHRQQPKQ
jgi:hypothetical protein